MTVKIPNIHPRGVRTSIPAGYILGRIDQGTGAVQLIPLAKLGAQLVAAGWIPAPGSVGIPGTVLLTSETGDPILQENGEYISP